MLREGLRRYFKEEILSPMALIVIEVVRDVTPSLSISIGLYGFLNSLFGRKEANKMEEYKFIYRDFKIIHLK